LKNQKNEQKTSHPKSTAKSRIWGTETLEPIATKFCMPGAPYWLIFFSKSRFFPCIKHIFRCAPFSKFLAPPIGTDRGCSPGIPSITKYTTVICCAYSGVRISPHSPKLSLPIGCNLIKIGVTSTTISE